jgi:hypothetical protein
VWTRFLGCSGTSGSFASKWMARTVSKVPCNDINGKVVSGTFERTMTFVIVIASDGRVLKANIDDSMFNPETLAKGFYRRRPQLPRVA